MSRIPLPERGQPLDLGYIYSIVETINDLAAEGAAITQKNNFIFKGPLSSKQSQRLLNAQVFATYVDILQSAQATSGEIKSQTVLFDPVFSSPPVVTATVVNNSTTSSAVDTSLTVTNVTSGSCTVNIKFATSGQQSVGVNVIAVGIPTRL